MSDGPDVDEGWWGEQQEGTVVGHLPVKLIFPDNFDDDVTAIVAGYGGTGNGPQAAIQDAIDTWDPGHVLNAIVDVDEDTMALLERSRFAHIGAVDEENRLAAGSLIADGDLEPLDVFAVAWLLENSAKALKRMAAVENAQRLKEAGLVPDFDPDFDPGAGMPGWE